MYYFLLLLLLLTSSLVQSQALPRCVDRPTSVLLPRVRPGFCLELIVREQNAGEWAFYGLAVDDAGVLYATRPQYGQLLAITDTDGDDLPDTPVVVAQGLDLPAALHHHEGSLYIAGGGSVYRWHGGTLTTLYDDLPTDTGIVNGGVTVWRDRLVVGVGAACDRCPPDPARGLLLSMALDGSDVRVLAEGFRQPSLLAVHNDVLWAGDIAPESAEEPFGDELNRVRAGAHYGYPDCPPQMTCEAPVYRFATHNSPAHLLQYNGAAFPDFAGQALLVMAGSLASINPVGFQVTMLERLGEPDAFFRTIVPYDTSITGATDRAYQPSGYYDVSVMILTRRGASFFPHRPLSAAVSAQGWVYIVASNGYLYVLRPVM
jgi:glucose/arabinose dehydrogenase